jgi:transcription-repair coupling factor (superfamily II helicase)
VAGPVSISLHLDIRIPPDYIPEENQRLRVYKRIAAAQSDEDRERLRQELADRYGPLPEGVRNLFEYAELKSLAERVRVEAVERRHDRVSIKFHPEARVDARKLMRFVGATPGAEFSPAGVLKFRQDGESPVQVKTLLHELMESNA